MKGQWSMTHGQALFAGIILALLVIVGYSYYLYHTFSVSAIMSTFQLMYQQLTSDPVLFGIIFIIGFIIGYLQGRAW